jgi:hypothetical protein
MERLETANDQFVTSTTYHTAEQISTLPVEKIAGLGDYEPGNTSGMISSKPGQTGKLKVDPPSTARARAGPSFLPWLN